MGTDEYRRVEPRGSVTLTEIPPNIYVGAKDANNTDGRAVSVYVPKQFPRSAIPTKPPTTTTNTTK